MGALRAGLSLSGGRPTQEAMGGATEASWPGGLQDDMHSATTGLLTLAGESGPSSALPHVRPLIIPEVRRPSLGAGSGSVNAGAPRFGTEYKLSRRPSFVEGGSKDSNTDAEFPALGNVEGRHAAQTYRWQQQHFGDRCDKQHQHS